MIWTYFPIWEGSSNLGVVQENVPICTDAKEQEKQDKFFMIFILAELQPDLDAFCNPILATAEVPTVDDLFNCLLYLSPPILISALVTLDMIDNSTFAIQTSD